MSGELFLRMGASLLCDAQHWPGRARLRICLLSEILTTVSCRNRLGIRLQGPRPKFARRDGGEGGSHPSNVHDHVYALGTVNYTGELHSNPRQ